MPDATKFQFTNPSVPKAYDEFFVPRLFEPWAKLLLDEIAPREGQALIDVATGPGTVARLAALRLGSQGRVVATDIAPAMLNIARAKRAVTRAAPIEYVESPAAPLNLPSSAFDVVVCQQGLQFFPDRLYALQEMQRVLKAGGHAAIAVFFSRLRRELSRLVVNGKVIGKMVSNIIIAHA
jgi:ubiquinone/menaquinone biosynthesis C-methylase UbiE